MVLHGGHNSKTIAGKVDSSFALKITAFILLVSFLALAESDKQLENSISGELNHQKNSTPITEYQDIEQQELETQNKESENDQLIQNLKEEAIDAFTEENNENGINDPRPFTLEEAAQEVLINDPNRGKNPEKYFEIHLEGLENIDDDEIVEVNTHGDELTKQDYIECQTKKIEIYRGEAQQDSMEKAIKRRCIDFFEPPTSSSLNGKEDQERNNIEEYYKNNNNFQSLEFEDISEHHEVIVESREREAIGYIIGENNYIIDIIHCDEERNGCNFRINGKVTEFLEVKNDENKNFLKLEGRENYIIIIESIKFNDCNGKRFCDYGYDTTDIVTLAVKKMEIINE